MLSPSHASSIIATTWLAEDPASFQPSKAASRMAGLGSWPESAVAGSGASVMPVSLGARVAKGTTGYTPHDAHPTFRRCPCLDRRVPHRTGRRAVGHGRDAGRLRAVLDGHRARGGARAGRQPALGGHP